MNWLNNFFKQIGDAQIFALYENLGYYLPCLIMYTVNNTSQIQVIFVMNSMTSNTNIRHMILIDPFLHFYHYVDLEAWIAQDYNTVS